MSSSERLQQLCHALLEGTASEPDRAELEQLLRQDDAALRDYVDQVSMHALLLWHHGRVPAEVPVTKTAGETGPAEKIVPLWHRRWRPVALAAAAVVVIAFWLSTVVKPLGVVKSPVVVAEAEALVAQVTGVKDCAFNPGDQLQRGQRVEIGSGVLELTFDCGAQITLEGPAVLALNSAWGATLERGALVADVPAEALGFRISHQAVEVVDLGTQFSLVAQPGGTAELYVLKGKVEATPRQQPALLLQESQARRFGPGGTSAITTPWPRRKTVKLDGLKRAVHFAHWSRAHPNAPAILSGLSDNAACTVAFWVQLPAETPLTNTAPMVAWRLNPVGRLGYQPVTIGWNANPNRGPLGALRTVCGQTTFIGSSPLCDGRRHLIAVVFSPYGRHHEKLQVSQYVDGRLDHVTIKTAKKEPRNVPGKPVDQTPRLGPALDELWVADQALTPRQMKQLVEANKPETLPAASRP